MSPFWCTMNYKEVAKYTIHHADTQVGFQSDLRHHKCCLQTSTRKQKIGSLYKTVMMNEHDSSSKKKGTPLLQITLQKQKVVELAGSQTRNT